MRAKECIKIFFLIFRVYSVRFSLIGKKADNSLITLVRATNYSSDAYKWQTDDNGFELYFPETCLRMSNARKDRIANIENRTMYRNVHQLNIDMNNLIQKCKSSGHSRKIELHASC